MYGAVATSTAATTADGGPSSSGKTCMVRVPAASRLRWDGDPACARVQGRFNSDGPDGVVAWSGLGATATAVPHRSPHRRGVPPTRGDSVTNGRNTGGALGGAPGSPTACWVPRPRCRSRGGFRTITGLARGEAPPVGELLPRQRSTGPIGGGCSAAGCPRHTMSSALHPGGRCRISATAARLNEVDRLRDRDDRAPAHAGPGDEDRRDGRDQEAESHQQQRGIRSSPASIATAFAPRTTTTVRARATSHRRTTESSRCSATTSWAASTGNGRASRSAGGTGSGRARLTTWRGRASDSRRPAECAGQSVARGSLEAR